MSKELVKLRTRRSRNGQGFAYVLDYIDEDGIRRRVSLGHADEERAKCERDQVERNLQQGLPCGRKPMQLDRMLKDHLRKTAGQVRRSTLTQQDIAMRHLIEAIGNIDMRDVHHGHGEQFIQARRDAGNAAGTINKDLRSIHRVFQLAVYRGHLEKNPFTHVRKPRSPKRKVHIYAATECDRLLRAARQLGEETGFDWGLLVEMALETGQRRGELLNVTWRDIDFDRRTVDVAPKKDTEHTWLWGIKDEDRRTIPLCDDLLKRLIERQDEAAPGIPYVFIPRKRYTRIQRRRRAGLWTEEDGKCPWNNFTRHWQQLLAYADVEEGEFHDLRRTALSRWVRAGMSEYMVMRLAGHSDFRTTHVFYLAVDDALLDQARTVMERPDFGARLARADAQRPQEEGSRFVKSGGQNTS